MPSASLRCHSTQLDEHGENHCCLSKTFCRHSVSIPELLWEQFLSFCQYSVSIPELLWEQFLSFCQYSVSIPELLWSQFLWLQQLYDWLPQELVITLTSEIVTTIRFAETPLLTKRFVEATKPFSPCGCKLAI